MKLLSLCKSIFVNTLMKDTCNMAKRRFRRHYLWYMYYQTNIDNKYYQTTFYKCENQWGNRIQTTN